MTESVIPGTESIVIFEPHVRRLPSLRDYLGEMWQRRQFITYLARSEWRARYARTMLGQVWTILNPLLLAGVYFLLLVVLGRGGRGTPEVLSVLISGIFFYYYTRDSVTQGARSVLGGQKLLLNSAFPRALLPTASVLQALLVFLPSVPVYLVIHLALGRPWGVGLLFIPLLIAVVTVFNLGIALFLAALNVYFRDTSSFLPYTLRLWLYLTPVLYSTSQIPDHLAPLFKANPLYPLFADLQRIVGGGLPSLRLLGATAWAVGMLVIGSLFFVTRERDFALHV